MKTNITVRDIHRTQRQLENYKKRKVEMQNNCKLQKLSINNTTKNNRTKQIPIYDLQVVNQESKDKYYSKR